MDAVATALRYEGFEVEEAYTGREALAAVARFDPDPAGHALLAEVHII